PRPIAGAPAPRRPQRPLPSTHFARVGSPSVHKSSTCARRRCSMRNYSVHVLAPRSALTIAIDPPIADNERHYIITVRGRGSVVVQPIDSARIAVVNPTDEISPFMFFVGRQFPLSAFPALSRFLGGL